MGYNEQCRRRYYEAADRKAMEAVHPRGDTRAMIQPGDRVRYSETFIESLRTTRDEDDLRSRRGRCLHVGRQGGRKVAVVEWDEGGETRALADYFTSE